MRKTSPIKRNISVNPLLVLYSLQEMFMHNTQDIMNEWMKPHFICCRYLVFLSNPRSIPMVESSLSIYLIPASHQTFHEHGSLECKRSVEGSDWNINSWNIALAVVTETTHSGLLFMASATRCSWPSLYRKDSPLMHLNQQLLEINSKYVKFFLLYISGAKMGCRFVKGSICKQWQQHPSVQRLQS